MLRNSKLTDYYIKKIIQCYCIDIPASKIALLLGKNRNTINRWYDIFRQAIYRHQTALKNKLLGRVEVDESYFGAKRHRGYDGKLKRGRGTLKQPVFGVFERDGRVYTEIVPDCKRLTLQAVILGKVSIESVIYSDGWRGYNGLVDKDTPSIFVYPMGIMNLRGMGIAILTVSNRFGASPNGGL